jgi:hypothetical protein
MLGEWTDELNGDDIACFVSTGPKSYAYKTSKSKANCKIKGYTLNHANAKKLNMEEMIKILNKEVDKILLEYNQITKNRKTHSLVNKTVQKKFKLDYDKRVMLPENDGIIDTLPYGY